MLCWARVRVLGLLKAVNVDMTTVAKRLLLAPTVIKDLRSLEWSAVGRCEVAKGFGIGEQPGASDMAPPPIQLANFRHSIDTAAVVRRGDRS